VTGLIDIVEADIAAADLLALLHAAAFCRPGDETWSAKSFSDVLGMAGAFCLIAQRQDDEGPEPVGFAACRVAGDESELLSIGVVPAYRKAGTARSLITRGIERCRAAGARHLTLEVAQDNPLAQELYQSLGFLEVGRRPAYYRRLHGLRVDAITMKLAIS